MTNKYSSILRKIIAVIILLALSGCGKDESPTENNSTGSIKGKITISNTGIPIISASLKTNPLTVSVLTDDSGNYILMIFRPVLIQ